MTNKQRQVQLDKKKWEDSELAECDLSGKMLYCKFCDKKINCLSGEISYNEMKDNSEYCAKAYNKKDKETAKAKKRGDYGRQ